uniref:TMF1 regulated nuclear protein 1 n=1 Tax=Rhinopithecus bieti TaxID=61621 RepID=A0A2K6KZN7_RHIBE
MPGCRISACGPGAQEGTAEPGSPPPPREPMPLSQPPPPTPTLTPTPTPGQSPPLPDAAGGFGRRGRRPGAAALAQGASGGSGAARGQGQPRRRLLEVEGRGRLVSELESRVLQLHRVFLAAELRLAHRAESLSRLSGGVAQAELYLAAHGSRSRRARARPSRPPPALLASAWPGRLPRLGGPLRRSPPRGPASPQR